MEAYMARVVDVREYLKHRPTPAEIAARVAWYHEWSRELDEINRESPMPYLDDGLERPLQQRVQSEG
jgi:hypothetical protein